MLELPSELSDTGTRRQLFFDTKAAATVECEKLRARKDNFGTSLTELTPARIGEAAEAYKLLEGVNVSLLSAVRSFMNSYNQRTASITFVALFN